MKLSALAAAFAVACLTLSVPGAVAQTLIDPAQVHQPATGYATLSDPMPAAGNEFATPTAYAPDGQVSLPWGDWLGGVLNYFYAAIVAFVLWLFRKLPKVAVDALNAVAGLMGQDRADKLLERAVAYGINTTAGAVKGKKLDIRTGNEVLERAFEYAIRHARSLVGTLGGAIQIREKIVARLDLDENAVIAARKPAPEEVSLAEAGSPIVTPVAPRS